jgi:hypothetical protein
VKSGTPVVTTTQPRARGSRRAPRRGCPKTVQPNRFSLAADIPFPPQSGAGLHGNPGLHSTRQHTFTVRIVLSLERFPARHGNHADARSLGLQRFTGGECDLDLGACRQNDALWIAAVSVSQNVGAPCNMRDNLGLLRGQHRKVLSR